MLVISDIEQGSDEWHQIRIGCITASRFKAVISGGQGKTRLAYMHELCAEIITQQKQESYNNEYMQWGTETEPQARDYYTLLTGNEVDQVCFVKCEPDSLNDLIGIGCSPDGLIGSNGLIEIKCPKTATQIETYLSGKMPITHKPQIQGQLMVTGREWCDFVSFDPRINGKSSFFKERIYRDDKYIDELKSKINQFKKEAYGLLERL